MPEALKFVLSIDSMPIMPSTITDQTVQLGDVKIPNQCWKGYYDIDTFSKSISDTSKPATYSEYFDFGKSIWNTGCGICAAIGAINFLTNGNVTVLDAYRKGLAIVYKSSNSSLVSFKNSKKFGVDTGDTQRIAYDIGRDYGWAKNSKNYTNTASIITTSKINAYKDLFYLPDGTYHQAKGPYQSGNQSDLKSYRDGAYVAAQAQAIERIKNMYFADYNIVNFLLSSIHRSKIKHHTADDNEAEFLPEWKIKVYNDEELLDEIAVMKGSDDIYLAKASTSDTIYEISGYFDFPHDYNMWLPQPLLVINAKDVYRMQAKEDVLSRNLEDESFEFSEDSDTDTFAEALAELSFFDFSNVEAAENIKKKKRVKKFSVEVMSGLIYNFEIYEAKDRYFAEISLETAMSSEDGVKAYVEKNKLLFDGWAFEISPERFEKFSALK